MQAKPFYLSAFLCCFFFVFVLLSQHELYCAIKCDLSSTVGAKCCMNKRDFPNEQLNVNFIHFILYLHRLSELLIFANLFPLSIELKLSKL